MFTRHVEPKTNCRQWWPAHVGMGIVLTTIIAVVIVVVALQPNRIESSRRVVVSFMDKGEAAAAQTGPTLARTERVRGYTWGGLVLRVDAGVSNAEVVQFYKRSVLVEDDPLVGAVGGTSEAAANARARSATVAVIDGAPSPGGPDFASERDGNGSCAGEHGRRMGATVGEPAVAVRALGKCRPQENGAPEGYASDIADAVVWAAGGAVDGAEANPRPARVLLLAMARRGACPSYLQAAMARATGELGALVVAAASDGGAENFPSNCAGVLSVGEAQSAGVAHVAASAPGGPGYAPAWVAALAAGLWTENTTAKAVRARLCGAAALCQNGTCGAVYGQLPEQAQAALDLPANRSQCPIDTFQLAAGEPCLTCPRGSYAAQGWGRCEACPTGPRSDCGYDCLTCGIPR